MKSPESLPKYNLSHKRLTAGHLPPDGSLLEPVLRSRLTASLTSNPSVGGPGQLAIEINL